MNESFLPQGEEKKAKDFRLPCSRYDAPTIEDWLTEKSSDGWRIYAWTDNAIKPNFTRSEPDGERYWVEPAWEDAAPTQAEVEHHETLGWKFVCRSYDGVYYIWRAAASGARKSRPKPMEDSYAYRKVRKSVRNSYLSLLAVVLLLIGSALFIDICSPYLVWRLVADTKLGLDILTFALSMVGAFWADWWERRALRRLKRSLAEGEAMQPVGRTGVAGKLVQFLPIIVGIAMLLSIAGGNVDSYFHDIHGYDADPVPFLSAETLGGTVMEERYVERRHTLLGGEITLVSEGGYAGFVKNYLWVQYSTQLEVYEPKIKFLAQPLADDICAQYFKDCTVEELDSRDLEKAYYSRDPDSGTQRLLLCSDGVVLYYHTDAPDDLRAHIDQFAAIMETRQKTS